MQKNLYGMQKKQGAWNYSASMPWRQAKEAIEDAGLEMDQEDPYMAGCAIGSGVGSLQAIEREHTRLIEKDRGEWDLYSFP